MNRIVLMLIAAATIAACTDKDGAVKAAENMGLSDVVAGGWAPMSCGDDTFRTHFTGKNAKGQPVRGVVCAGWFKGATVRMF